MHQEGSIVLGTGGDGGNTSIGSFFERVMTARRSARKRARTAKATRSRPPTIRPSSSATTTTTCTSRATAARTRGIVPPAGRTTWAGSSVLPGR